HARPNRSSASVPRGGGATAGAPSIAQPRRTGRIRASSFASARSARLHREQPGGVSALTRTRGAEIRSRFSAAIRRAVSSRGSADGEQSEDLVEAGRREIDQVLHHGPIVRRVELRAAAQRLEQLLHGGAITLAPLAECARSVQLAGPEPRRRFMLLVAERKP